MAGIKSLAKDTAIYGMSSIIGRFLNWCLVPLYTYKLATGEFGSVSNLYAWIGLLLVILICGLETGFFRFANDSKEEDPKITYSTCLFSLSATSLLFLGIVILFLSPLSHLLDLPAHPEYVLMMAVITAMDAFISLPYAYLRFQKRPYRFAAIKMLFIALNIALNLFFLIACPWLAKHQPEWINWFYNPGYGVGYILLANLLAKIVETLALMPEITGIRWRFRADLLKRILRYSFPLLILGVAGIMNQTIDKILFPMLFDDPVEALSELGIYTANYKIAIVMVMFIQAFRYAYEPFIFAQNKDNDKSEAYAAAMKYFIILGLFIFLGVMFYLDILRYFIDPRYFPGLKVVPVIMLAELFFGIFFNLSLWYKLTDKTRWGAYFSIFGLIITLFINIAFVPRYGYIACAWAAFACYSAMMVSSYFIGQHYYPIKYDLKAIGKYFLLTLVLYLISLIVPIDNVVLRLIFRSILILVFLVYLLKNDLPLKEIPYINRFLKK